MKRTIPLAFILLLLTGAVAQGVPDMLEAFSTQSIVRGKILVFFPEPVTRQEAESTLAENSLKDYAIEVCGAKGQQPVTRNDSAKGIIVEGRCGFEHIIWEIMATVTVQKGSESKVAEELIKSSKVSWVAPVIAAPQPDQPETPEEKLLRMLLAFNDEGIVQGSITVSFTKGATKAQAQAVLSSFGLKISQSQVCTQAAGPGQQPSKPECRTTDNWFDSISAADVAVPKGREKEFTQALYQHPNILWIEPDWQASVGSEGSSAGKETPEQREQRMLEAFDWQIAKGSIIVSFTEDIDKAKAQGILSSYGLKMSRSTACIMGQEGQKCETKDNWFPSLSAAAAVVQEGLEKDLARKLYSHASVTWVEPDLVFKAASSKIIKQIPGPPQDSRTVLLVAGIIVAFVIIAIVKKR